MKIEIVQTNAIASYVGVRASSLMTNLGSAVSSALQEVVERSNEIANIRNREVTYGITPPNYKGNDGLLDFYCCYEVEPLANVPQGMVHLHLLPRLYSVTYYRGAASKLVTAYDFTSQWLAENGYEYDDVSYYLERYDEKTTRETDDERNEIAIYCPIKKKAVE
ncbi:GyrI-like domain-containing protein [Paenibacillus sp. CF384]|uniref:GyrI-like domain-containing protein n=1 Tax=Paenibacillus sp. CF384 TaxID=1884382 RepID=UPI00089C38CD|nr:GyrI-like domain-containing protein [Paenibacillus sp. CF384]SDX50348.1 Predicted transcriptional regulator YdeE, contains AraC-type DNA-binding domain [Paenibacillus sp. CF384]